MNHVFTRHCQLDASTEREMELVDLTLSVGMLNTPHPLFSGNEDLESFLRRLIHLEIELGAPGKNDHGDEKWDDRPGDLEFHCAFDRLGDLIFSSSPVFDSKVKDRYADCD